MQSFLPLKGILFFKPYFPYYHSPFPFSGFLAFTVPHIWFCLDYQPSHSLSSPDTQTSAREAAVKCLHNYQQNVISSDNIFSFVFNLEIMKDIKNKILKYKFKYNHYLFIFEVWRDCFINPLIPMRYHYYPITDEETDGMLREVNDFPMIIQLVSEIWT